jgi:hypothetical protein
MQSENARDLQLKRCGVFGGSIFVVTAERIISAAVGFEAI